MLKGMHLKEKRLKEGNTLLKLEPAAVQVLHELVSLVHNSVSASQDQQSLSTTINDCQLVGNDKCEIVTDDLKDDPVAKILWEVEPDTLQYAFLAMAVSLYYLQSLHTLEKFVGLFALLGTFSLGCFNYG